MVKKKDWRKSWQAIYPAFVDGESEDKRKGTLMIKWCGKVILKTLRSNLNLNPHFHLFAVTLSESFRLVFSFLACCMLNIGPKNKGSQSKHQKQIASSFMKMSSNYYINLSYIWSSVYLTNSYKLNARLRDIYLF